jgi:hypothetical protein
MPEARLLPKKPGFLRCPNAFPDRAATIDNTQRQLARASSYVRLACRSFAFLVTRLQPGHTPP